MPGVTFSAEDLLRGKLLEPTWYLCTITDATEKVSNDGDSNNTWIDFKIKTGPKQKDGSSPIGVPLRVCFNEKATAFSGEINFVKALLNGKDPEAGKEYKYDQAKGKDIEVYVTNGLYNNKMQNQCADYRPAKEVK